jgi:hypothetical protein
MSETNDFALLPRPPGALGKAEPGAKRILAGMVSDTLALAKKGSLQKPTFTALLGLDHFAGIMELVFASKLGETHNLRFFYFTRSSELLKLAEEHPFDLVFMYIGNIVWDVASTDGSWCGAAGVLGELKARYGKAIVATQGLELSAELEPKGVIFLETPITIETFWARLPPELAGRIDYQSPKGHFSVAICAQSPGDDLDTMFFTLPLHEVLGAEYAVGLHYFEHPGQWEMTLGEYDLYVLYLNPAFPDSTANGDVDPYKLVAELKANHRRPVILLTNGGQYSLDCAPSFMEAGADGFFSFLPPFPTGMFKQALKRCVAKSLALRGQGAP